MCGLSGVISNWLSGAEIERFKELMLFSNLRGMSGAGVISVGKNQEVCYNKTLGNGIDVCNTKDFDELTSTSFRPSILIGHTRWPTKGGVTIDMTHPHEEGHIIGVHNGTMDTVMGESTPASKSDSALLYKAIAEHGVDAAINNSCGAYALMWTDEKNKTFNILRNGKRTLYYGLTEDKKTIYFSSEAGFLHLMFTRANMKNYTVKSVPENQLHSFKLNVEDPLKEHEIREVKGSEVPARTPFLQGGGVWTGQTGFIPTHPGLSGTKGGAGNPVVPFLQRASPKNNVESKPKRGRQDGEAQGFTYRETQQGYFVTSQMYQSLLNQGCAWCGTISGEDNPKDIEWIGKREFACADCKNEEWVQEYAKAL